MPPETQNTGGAAATSSHSMGPLIGALIVLIVLIIGGYYLWDAKQTKQMQNTPPFILGDTNLDVRESLPPTSNSDAVNEIDADISATDLGALEAEINSDLKAVEGAL